MQVPSTSFAAPYRNTSSGKTKTVKGIRRKNYLRQVNANRLSDLSHKEQILYKNFKTYVNKLTRLQQKVTQYKERLSNCEQLIHSKQFSGLTQYVNKTTYNFILSQVRNQMAKPPARRFTLDEKILALTIFKSSGKAYRLLSKIFALPSSRCLLTLLQRISFTPGINSHIFESLKENVSLMENEQDKICIVMFDEIHIDCHVQYSQSDDIINGLADDGVERTVALADFANVFFLKGVYRQWKQPICFTFSSGPLTAAKLKNSRWHAKRRGLFLFLC